MTELTNTQSALPALVPDNDFPLRGWGAYLAIPTYGHPDPRCQKDVRVAMMVASKYGLTWEGDASPDRMGWGHGRNMVAQHCLESPDVTGVMWIDSDMRIPPDSIARLLATAREHKIEFITGVYHQRGGYNTPVFYHFSKEKKAYQPYKEYPDNALYPVEGCGFGFVWTSWKTINAIARLKTFDPRRGWFPDDRDSGGFGEDLNFCYQAAQAGIELYVDTGVQLGHLGEPEVVTRETYLKKKAEVQWTLAKAEEADKAGRWGLKK